MISVPAAVSESPSINSRREGACAVPLLQAERDLVERYLPLVRSVVDRVRLHLPQHVEADDLYSVGVTGLVAAVRRYDPCQERTFAGYATLRIRGAVLDELRRLDWRPRRARARARQLKETIQGLEQELGRPATEEEIRQRLQLSPKDFAQMLEEVRPACFVALDQTADEANPERGSLHETIADESVVLAADSMEKEELLRLVASRIQELPEVQRKVIAMYYFENMRLAEIAAVFNLTESRICQIHSQVVAGLRAYIARARNK
jgi:RNA polymerase sigma factor FliA